MDAALEEALERIRAGAWEAGFHVGHCYGAQQERWLTQGDYADPRDEPSRPRNPYLRGSQCSSD
jgi:hypothetical protein